MKKPSDSFIRPTKERIFDAAVDLFSQKGFNGVSIREISRQVGIKESSFYNHYQSKEELQNAILNRFKQENLARPVPAQALGELIKTLSVEDFWKRSLTNYMDFWEPPARMKLWFVVSMEQYSNRLAGRLVLEETHRLLELLESIFQEMIVFGKVKPLNPKMLASTYGYAIRAMHLEYGILKILNKDPSELKKHMFDFVRFFADSIQSGPDQAGKSSPGLRSRR